MNLKIKKLHIDAKLPTYATLDDAGMDLYALEDTNINPMERVLVKTGIAMEIPEGHVGLIWDKSGVVFKLGQKTIGGVVDAGYRGEILVAMVNLTDKLYTFKKGDKVAQMIIQPKVTANIIESEELNDSERGEGGFGSSDK